MSSNNMIYNGAVGDVDIIFAGGGTAACVAAGRLAKANPDLKIVLVEGGPNNYQNPTITNPAFYLSHLVPDSKNTLVSNDTALSWATVMRMDDFSTDYAREMADERGW